VQNLLEGLLLSFSCDCAAHDFRILSFLQIFDELYLVQFSTNHLDILSANTCICRLDACNFIELETTALIFRVLRELKFSNGNIFRNIEHDGKQLGIRV
jgi:hypothetical protein